jgi:hypothetical protein
MKKQPNPVVSYIREGSPLHNLLTRNRGNKQLLDRIRDLLPEQIREHCTAATIENRRVILYAESSAWASRLRFLSRDLARQLNQNNIAADRINVRVFLNQPPKRNKRHIARQLSPDNAALIDQTAETISDSSLRAALKRLCRHTR